MSKARIIGALFVVAGFVLRRYIENDSIDFVAGILVGIGVGITLTGRFNFNK